VVNVGDIWVADKKKNYIPEEMVVQIDHHRAGREDHSADVIKTG
jgi:hypothetical protein